MPRKFVLMLVMAALAFGAKTPRPLPDVPISTPGGKKIELTQYPGKVILLALISASCADCIGAVELMNKMQKESGPRGFQAVAAIVGLDAQQNTQGFIDRYRPGFPVGFLLEAPFRQMADIGVRDRPFVPIFLFIDRKGVVRFQYYGTDAIMQQRDKATRSIVEGLLRQ